MVVGDAGQAPIPVEDGSVWVDVGTYRSAYERGYERGDPEFFVRLAEWLEERIPQCEVWYGNEYTDSSIRLFSVKERQDLMEYYHRLGHEPYDKKPRTPPSP